MKSNSEVELNHSVWQRFFKRLVVIDEAINTGPEEIQDQRITRLEADVSEIRALLAADETHRSNKG
jgi:hypothetical protein